MTLNFAAFFVKTLPELYNLEHSLVRAALLEQCGDHIK